ncbi:MAG: hypothetical protein WBD41_11030, partial [Rhodococcus sp. (in: high G+C Gram-positive bacteria)]
MNRRVALLVIASAVSGLLFAAVVTSQQVDLGGWPSWTYVQQDDAPIIAQPPPIIAELPPIGEDPDPVTIPAWLETLFRIVLYTIGLVAI